MKKKCRWAFVCVIVFALVSSVQAGFARTEDAIAYRKAVMLLLAHHFGLIGAVVKGQVIYQHQEVSDNTRLVWTFSTLPWEAFKVPGSDQGATELKSTAFQKQGQFEEAAKALEAATAKLTAAAESGTLDAVKPQFGAVGQSCKNCHEQFKSH